MSEQGYLLKKKRTKCKSPRKISPSDPHRMSLNYYTRARKILGLTVEGLHLA